MATPAFAAAGRRIQSGPVRAHGMNRVSTLLMYLSICASQHSWAAVEAEARTGKTLMRDGQSQKPLFFLLFFLSFFLSSSSPPSPPPSSCPAPIPSAKRGEDERRGGRGEKETEPRTIHTYRYRMCVCVCVCSRYLDMYVSIRRRTESNFPTMRHVGEDDGGGADGPIKRVACWRAGGGGRATQVRCSAEARAQRKIDTATSHGQAARRQRRAEAGWPAIDG